MKCLARVICTCVLVALATSASAENSDGTLLSAYLDSLNERGLKVIYTSDLVPDSLRIGAVPAVDDLQEQLAQVLEPLGLGLQPGPSGSLLVVRGRERPAGVVGPASGSESVVAIPEVVVTSSLHRLEYSVPGTHTYLDRQLTTRMPAVADEAVRITHRLPGTASGGVSAQSHIRGGEVNEVLFVFDGLRLYEPYHLKDFQTVASIVGSNTVAGIDFISGAYPARYGDRMSGVMNIDMRRPGQQMETELALSFFNASALSMGRFGGNGRGEWLASARRGNLDLVADVVDPDAGDPHYQDYLVHLAWDFGPRSQVSANVLASSDKILLADSERGEFARADYRNEVAWFKWRADWTESLTSTAILAYSDISDRRSGTLDLPGIVSGELSENHEFGALEIRQDWSWVLSPTWMVRFGFAWKDLDAKYRFFSVRTVEPPFDTLFGNQAFEVRDAEESPAGHQAAVYSEVRWRARDEITIDMGLRWDEQGYTKASGDRQFSPRLAILYQPTAATELRLGWGQFHQAQEINELQLSDGEAGYFPVQRAEHFVVNLQHQFRQDFDVSLSIYRKSFRRLRPRFENAFNTLTLLPELQFDREKVDPSGAEASGIEVFLAHGSGVEDLFWWLGYAWSKVEDELPGGQVRRSWDQTHTLKAGLTWRWGEWNFSAAAEGHTGWPRTQLFGEQVSVPGGGSELVLDISERNARRDADFYALDARVSRDFDVGRGSLTTYLEIFNLLNRANPCCTEYSLRTDGSLASRDTHWLPLVPSLGVEWRF